MLQALLRGKMSREQENMEDILTSNVVGLLRYLPPQKGLIPFLRPAESLDRVRPLEMLPIDAEPASVPHLYSFWPRFNEPECALCEPDLLLRLDYPDGRRFRILIEAKYRSGKSSEANDDDDELDESPKDQLALQWAHLIRLARRESARPFLIYLTAHIACPTSQIEDSIREYQKRQTADPEIPAILFLSWRHIPEVFGGNDDPILSDLCQLARRLDLRFFHGIPVPRILRTEWRFDGSATTSAPLRQAPTIQWSFSP